jgi:hypothetical protein
VLGLDPDVDVDALAARGLRVADGTEIVEDLVYDVGHAADAVERAIGHRVQVDPPLVRLLGVGAAAVPRVELDRRHLHGPRHMRDFGDAQFVGGPVVPREVHPYGLHPRRRSVRQPLLVHLLAGDALGEPMHHAWPLPQCAHDPVPDGQVVVDQIELRLSPRREVDPIRIRDPHGALADLQLHRRSLRLPRLGLCHAAQPNRPNGHPALRRGG